MTRQELLAAGAGTYLALLLGGCGSGGSDSDEITFWNGFTGGDGPTMLELLDAYTKESGTPVKMVSVRWEDFYQKVPAAVGAGRGPDVAIMHVDQIATRAAHDVLRPIDDLPEQLGLQELDFAPDAQGNWVSPFLFTWSSPRSSVLTGFVKWPGIRDRYPVHPRRPRAP